MNAMLDNVYDSFLQRVAAGRKISVAQADRVARGRVWTGAQAKANGLVDELGGLTESLDHAAVKAGAQDRGGIDVVIMPKPKTVIEQFIELLEGQVRAGEAVQAYAPLLELARPYLREASVAARPGDFMTYDPAPATR